MDSTEPTVKKARLDDDSLEDGELIDSDGDGGQVENTEVFEDPLIKLEENSSVIISGSSKSGKTYWICNFLKNLDQMFKGQTPVEVVYYYMHHQPLYDEMKKALGSKIKFKEGVPDIQDISEIAKDKQHKLVVLDDVMHLAVNNDDIALLFTQLVHHKRLSCLVVLQNLYQSGKHAKTIKLNSTYLVLFNNIRDKGQISYLGRQMYPGQCPSFIRAYKDAVSPLYSYLFIDSSPIVSDAYRLRTDIFPGEEMQTYRF